MLELIRTLLKRVLQVDVGPPEAPLGEHPEMFQASQKHLTYLMALWAIRHGSIALFAFVPLAGGLCAALVKTDHEAFAAAVVVAMLAFFAVFAVFGYASIRLDWEMRWYVLTDRSLRIREGIVFMREVTLTLANVQELKVSQGPIQRALGITDLIVDTAGGGGSAASGRASIYGHEGMLRGIDNGSDVRKKIEARVKQRRGAGLGDPDENPGRSGGHHEIARGVAGVALDDVAFVSALRELRDEVKRLRGVAILDTK